MARANRESLVTCAQLSNRVLQCHRAVTVHATVPKLFLPNFDFLMNIMSVMGDRQSKFILTTNNQHARQVPVSPRADDYGHHKGCLRRRGWPAHNQTFPSLNMTRSPRRYQRQMDHRQSYTAIMQSTDPSGLGVIDISMGQAMTASCGPFLVLPSVRESEPDEERVGAYRQTAPFCLGRVDSRLNDQNMRSTSGTSIP